MIIKVSVDSKAWSAALDALLIDSAEQARQASLQGAQEIRDRARGLLNAQSHAPYTFSPSKPGEPPARIDGNLSASMTAELFGDEAWVGPTAGFGRTGFYARIQELGGDMRGHPYMHFFVDGEWWDRRFIALPDRPYLRPATEDEIDSGRLYEIYAEHQLQAIMEATG